MSTGIEWTDDTWNPTTGCTKVSEGCDHCYAERITNRFGGPGAFDTVVLHPDRLDKPLHWRKPRRVFVDSMSDLFHDDVPDDFIRQVFSVMARSPQHVFQILTKRPGRMASFLRHYDEVARELQPWGGPWPLPNVWLGTSVENQRWADVRIPKLLETPAAVRFLSCEPLLGKIWLEGAPRLNALAGLGPTIDWVIVGGESGPEARPMHPDWVRSIRDQCVAAGVPFFFKQWGEWSPEKPQPYYKVSSSRFSHQSFCWGNNGEPYNGRDPDQWIGSTTVYRVGKRAAGRELDRRVWDELPSREAVLA